MARMEVYDIGSPKLTEFFHTDSKAIQERTMVSNQLDSKATELTQEEERIKAMNADLETEARTLGNTPVEFENKWQNALIIGGAVVGVALIGLVIWLAMRKK